MSETYFIHTVADTVLAYDTDEAREGFDRWVKRHARNGEFYWLVDKNDQIIHAGDIATNPKQLNAIDTHGLYVDNQGDGTFVAYVDGWIGDTRGHDSYAKAAREYFTGWAAGGYNALYFREDDNYLLGPACPQCACEDWLEHEKSWAKMNDDGDERYMSDICCAFCSTIITAQICSQCGDQLIRGSLVDRPLPIFYSGYGNGLHGECLADYVVKGEAYKSGFQSYTFRAPYAQDHWFVNGPFITQETVYAESAKGEHRADSRAPLDHGSRVSPATR
jgi:hypothetical protein